MAKSTVKPGLKATTALRAALYLRQSLDISGEELAVSRQEQANRAYCKAKGWTVVAVYRENDTSASGRTPRQKFTQMLADAANGEFDVIVATFLDRLTRSVRDLLPLVDLYRQRGVATATVRDGIDLTTDVGELVATILAAVANLEIRRKGERQQLANDQRAEAGRPHIGGARPVGYDAVVDPSTKHRMSWTIRESEAVHIRAAYDAILAGRSASAVARDLNQAGLRTTKLNTKRAGLFSHNGVKQLLTNPRYAGLKVHRGEIVGKANWDPIVDEATWRAACAVLTDPSRRTNPTHSGGRVWLGTGLYRCGVCADGTTMVSNYADGGRRVYVCRSGKHLSRVAEPVDRHVVAAVLDKLASPDARDLLIDHHRPDLTKLRTRLRQLDDLDAENAEDRHNGVITRAQLHILNAKTMAERSEIEAKMGHTSRTNVLSKIINADDVDAEWRGYEETGDIELMQAIVAGLCTVVVHKARPGGNSRLTSRPLPEGSVIVDFDRP